MAKWNLDLVAENETLGNVIIRRGVFQGGQPLNYPASDLSWIRNSHKSSG